MKTQTVILHISSTGRGGPGYVMRDITRALDDGEFENIVITPRDTVDYAKHYRLNQKSFYFSRLLSKFYEKKSDAYLIKDTFWPEVYCKDKTHEIMNAVTTSPDILILYWYKNFIDTNTIASFKKLHKNVRIFIYLMDYAPLTGGCHYPISCTNYAIGCYHCPAVKTSKRVNICSKNAEKAKGVFEECGVEIIAPNSESLSVVKQSYITKNLKHHLLLIPLAETNVQKFDIDGLDFTKKCICVAVQNFKDERKGSKYMIQILNTCYDNLTETERSEILIVVVGNCDDEDIAPIKFNKIKVGYLSIEQLYYVFSKSSLFLSTTIADMGPMTISQALSNGLPVASFEIGSAIDLVKHEETGYISKLEDCVELSSSITRHVRKSGAQLKQMRMNCISFSKNNLEFDVFKKHISCILSSKNT